MRVLSCLIEYCKVRYEQCGRRLSVLVKAKENMQNESVLGFFMLDKDAGRIYSMTHSDGNGGYKFMTHDFAGANDWEVLKPWSLEAVLHSAELDTNIKLVSRFRKTQDVEFGPESDQWDIPHEQVVAIAAGIPFASAQRVVAAPPASIAGPPPPGSGASLPKATPPSPASTASSKRGGAPSAVSAPAGKAAAASAQAGQHRKVAVPKAADATSGGAAPSTRST